MTTFTESADGTRLAFDRIGEGAPIILVHPAFGHRAFDPPMAQLAQLLSSRFSIVTYDRRGRGESGDAGRYAVEREVDDIAALVKEAGGEACLYGMSSGGVLALEAVICGVAIKALALYEPPFIIDDGRPPYPEDYVARLAQLLAAGRRGDAVAYAMTNVGLPEAAVDQMRSQPFWPAFEAVAHTLVYDGMVMGDTQRGRPLPSQRFRNVNVPALVIVGSKAPAWARNSGESLAAALPYGKLQFVEADFHAPDANALAPLLTEFFAAAGVPASPQSKRR
jgi:pimeloyl-ACP methyl ester carboxylesterase